jgi:phosphate starvation-inducible PhoH-like protein
LSKETISISGLDTVIKLFGNYDENIRLLSAEFDVDISLKDDKIEINGQNAALCKSVMEKMADAISRGGDIDRAALNIWLPLLRRQAFGIRQVSEGIVAINAKGKR